MNVEKIFRKIPVFNEITIDKILFESKYPVMFTCKNGADIYLFICCLVNATKVKWIGTKTDYNILINLLENKVTIRDAFLSVTEEKQLVEYDGTKVLYDIVESKNISDELLPTSGEYMDAEEGEFAEEIAIFRSRNENFEYKIQPRINSFWILNFLVENINLSDDYFNTDLKINSEITVGIGKITNQNVIYA